MTYGNSTRVLVRDDGVSSAKYYRYTAYGECKKEMLSISQSNKSEDVKTVRPLGMWPGRSEVLTYGTARTKVRADVDSA